MSDKKVRVIFVPVDHLPQVVEISDDEDKRLADMQRLVGGYIELVRLEDGLDMWINEEGAIHGLPMNEWVSLMDFFGVIYGPVFFARSNADGDLVSVSDEDVQAFRAEVKS